MTPYTILYFFRLTTRYEKLSVNFLAMVHIFAIRLSAN